MDRHSVHSVECRRDRESLCSVSDSASTFGADSYPPLRIDRVQPRLPFRLHRNMDSVKPVYEGWTIYTPQDGSDSANTTVLPTNHSQEELAAIHMSILDTYHGTHRGNTGCLPLRRLLRRTSYDDDLDRRIHGSPRAFQDELADLLADRSYHSSTVSRDRDWTVAVVREQLRRRFVAPEPTPARRHRLRWWRNNTRGRETEMFVIIIGRETRHELSGIPVYARFTNPWHRVDQRLAVQEREAAANKERARGFFGSLFEPPETISRSSSRHERLRRRPPPPSVPSLTQESRFDSGPRLACHPMAPGLGTVPMTHGFRPFSTPDYIHDHWPYIPPPPPANPLHLRHPCPGPPPVYRASPDSPVNLFPSTMHGSAPMPPSPPPPPPPPPPHHPIWGYRPSPPPIPHHPATYFQTPPLASWPPSPFSHQSMATGSVYNHPPPPPPPVPNAYSNLTTPSSLSSIHVPMFGPIPPLPPVIPRYPSPPYSPRFDEEKERDMDSDAVAEADPPAGPSRPSCEGSEDEKREENKSLAKDKPSRQGDE